MACASPPAATNCKQATAKGREKSFTPESDKWYDFLFSVLLGADQKDSMCIVIFTHYSFGTKIYPAMWMNTTVLPLN